MCIPKFLMSNFSSIRSSWNFWNFHLNGSHSYHSLPFNMGTFIVETLRCASLVCSTYTRGETVNRTANLLPLCSAKCPRGTWLWSGSIRSSVYICWDKGSQIFLSLCSHSDPLETLQSLLKLHGCEGDNLMTPLHEVQCLCVQRRIAD